MAAGLACVIGVIVTLMCAWTLLVSGRTHVVICGAALEKDAARSWPVLSGLHGCESGSPGVANSHHLELIQTRCKRATLYNSHPVHHCVPSNQSSSTLRSIKSVIQSTIQSTTQSERQAANSRASNRNSTRTERHCRNRRKRVQCVWEAFASHGFPVRPHTQIAVTSLVRGAFWHDIAFASSVRGGFHHVKSTVRAKFSNDKNNTRT